MKPLSHYRNLVTTLHSGGNAEVTKQNATESLTSADSNDSLLALPLLPPEKQSLQFAEILLSTESDVINKTINGGILSVEIIEKSNAPITASNEPFGDSISVTPTNLQWWIEQLKGCFNQEEVFHLLKQFQPLNWTDIERATMAHAYHKRLESIPPERLPACWYEIKAMLDRLCPGHAFEVAAGQIVNLIKRQPQSERMQILKKFESWQAGHTNPDWARRIIGQIKSKEE